MFTWLHALAINVLINILKLFYTVIDFFINLQNDNQLGF